MHRACGHSLAHSSLKVDDTLQEISNQALQMWMPLTTSSVFRKFLSKWSLKESSQLAQPYLSRLKEPRGHSDELHLRMSQPGIKHSLLTPTETLVLHHHSLSKWNHHLKWSYLTYIVSPKTSWGDSPSLMTWKCPNLCNQWIYKKVYRPTLTKKLQGLPWRSSSWG